MARSSQATEAGESPRHARQVILPGVGEDGQRRLRGSHALIVGCGALGSAVAETLCRAGVGTLTIVDRDIVELTNLQRQTLFTERDAHEATPKAEAARRRLKEIDSALDVRAVVADFNQRNAEAMLDGAPASILIDGADNFETRYLLNDLAVKRGLPLVYAGVVGTRGMTMNIVPDQAARSAPRPRPAGDDSAAPLPRPAGEGRGGGPTDPQSARTPTPCLRCVFETPPPAGSAETCETAGVFGPAVQTITGWQAAEALKILLGAWDDVGRDLVEVDVWSGAMRRVSLAGAKRDDCLCCARRRFEYLEGARGAGAAVLCGRGAVQVGASTANGATIDLEALATRLGRVGDFTSNEFLIRGVLADERGDEGEPVELTVFRDGRAIVKGARTPERARALYSRFVGD